MACHSTSDPALISVVAYDRPFQRQSIAVPYLTLRLAGIRAFMGGSLTVPAVLSPSIPPIDRLAHAFLTGEAVVPADLELSFLNDWIDQQFKEIPVMVRFTGTDIDLQTMVANFDHTGELLISVAHNDHPFLSGFQNAKFRAVHDWHHLVVGADSSFRGEVATFKHAAMHAPKEMRWMLFSEIVLQAATAISTGDFAAQKLVRIPGL